MKNKLSNNQMVLFKTTDGKVSVDVLFSEKSVWLTLEQLSILFERNKSTISRHIGNIFSENELERNSVVANYATTASDGKTYQVDYYNLDMIISIGYRVNSPIGTQFRQWATKHLKEFMIKGFILDDERLKQGVKLFDEDYFQELLERIRSIRASERRIWQKITDIFAECSTDYNVESSITKEFFAMVQNKFHYAITGQTAPEIIYHRADRNKKNMGLTSWKNSPSGRILLSDTKIAKNYLSESNIKELESTVSSYFDYIERHIKRKNTFTMSEFSESVNKFLTFEDYKILHTKGKISKKMADEKAEAEYYEFNKTQEIISDFDKATKHLTRKDENV